METAGFYKNYIDKKVKVVTQEMEVCEGVCRSIDGYLNVVLEDAMLGKGECRMRECLIRGLAVKHIVIIE